MIETINSFSTTVVAISAIASAFIALRMYKLENSRDLPASNFHCWISRDSFSFGTINDWNTFANLKLAISNRSQLPIYSLRIAIVSKSRIAIDDVLIVPKGEIIYFKTMDFVDDLKTEKVDNFSISPEDIIFKPLSDFINRTHKDPDARKIMERIASELTVDFQFMDIYNQVWVRRGGKKLKRKHFYRRSIKGL